MKTLAVIFLLLFSPLLPAQEGNKLELQGNYTGENLYIQNPYASSGEGFCVTEVWVNGVKDTSDNRSAAFEINLKRFGLKNGDPLYVVIYHHDDCQPKVLNPYHHTRPQTDFKKTWLDSSYALHFIVEDETAKNLYTIEQFKWNKWVKIGEVESKGLSTPEEYVFDVSKFVFHGENKFRVRLPYSSLISSVATCNSGVQNTMYTVTCREILFSTTTAYELYDQYGNVVKKGVENRIDLSSLKAGGYYLNYDNTTVMVKVKKCPDGKTAKTSADSIFAFVYQPGNVLNISTPASFSGDKLLVELISIDGRVISRREAEGGGMIQVDITGIARGICFIRITREESVIYNKEISVPD